jgi:hypothetical protein
MSGSNRPQVFGLVIITPGDVRPEPRLQRFEVDPPALGGRDVLHPIARKGRGGGVGAVGAFRHQHDLALVAARLQRRADREQATQFAVRARLRAHRHECMPVSFTSHSPSVAISSSAPWTAVLRLAAGECPRSLAAAPSSR